MGSCGGDMRLIMNQLQMLSNSTVYKTTGVKYMDMKDRIKDISKDAAVMMGPFDACKKLLNTAEARQCTFKERLDMFFVDFSLVGLLVQENYMKAVERNQDPALLHRCALSADLLTIGDIMNSRINLDQEWSMLPDMGIVSSVYPSYITNGFVAFPNFPAYLGKHSTMSRAKRLATELQAHLRLNSSVSTSELVTSGYADLLYRRLVDPLRR